MDSIGEPKAADVVLVGLGNYGSGLAEYLLRRDRAVVGVDFDPVALERWRARGMPVLYGDMADPELHEHLPLGKARWVVSTVRSRELNLALLQHLRSRGYEGKVALTAADPEEASLLERAGAHVVFRPFADAAEQAADALTHAIDVLPGNIDWPIALREVRIRSESAAAGQTIRNIPLRARTGASILAISRAGRVLYDPEPDFLIYPGDRLVIMGSADDLRRAESLLSRLQDSDDVRGEDQFVTAEVRIARDSALVGQTLADVRFRQRHGVTVVGIRRGKSQITTPSPAERLLPEDHLIVVGNSVAVESLKRGEPL